MNPIKSCLTSINNQVPIAYVAGGICVITAIALLIIGRLNVGTTRLAILSLSGGVGCFGIGVLLVKWCKEPKWLVYEEPSPALHPLCILAFDGKKYVHTTKEMSFNITERGKLIDKSGNYYYQVEKDAIYVRNKMGFHYLKYLLNK